MSLSFVNMNAQDLETHRWENRVIIVKTTDPFSVKFQTQLKEFKGVAKEMMERKFVLYTIFLNDYVLINYENLTMNSNGIVSKKLAKILNNKESFEIILIGLDGAIKLRQTEILTKKQLFDKVDSMPMRSNEIRRKQKKN